MVNYLLPNRSDLMLRLSSNPRNVSRVEAFVERIAHKYKIAPDLYGNILISLTEAVKISEVYQILQLRKILLELAEEVFF